MKIIPFNNDEFIFAFTQNGSIIILCGPHKGTVESIKKLRLDLPTDITTICVTSQSQEEKSLDLVIGTSDGI
jgi:hypothetical protein